MGVAMMETSLSLLERLRRRHDPASWQRLVDVYTPLLRGWLRRHFLQEADCDDLVQEVLLKVSQELPHFEHNGRTGAFRTWLRQVMVNRIREFHRRAPGTPTATGDSGFAERLGQLEDPQSDLSRAWDEEHDRLVVRRLLEMIAVDFEPATWEAFRRLTLEGQRAADVAAGLGLTANAVYIAKSRVMARLQQEVAGLVDADALS
jgi:RNA polymerase sigma factor (sigma-70 family)